MWGGPKEVLPKEIAVPITVMRCEVCGTNHTRPHQEQDFVFKKLKSFCPKCNAETEMVVVSIHVEEKKQKT
ncbi:MAG: hypothetical protein NZ988_06435 [Thaumarchaeota archaeon]|nr:hypothetical protein [Candidatus Calditenuaceae archaeon]MDW8187659.1 hypothetical protein [Nitrososphaerota archaeon]